MKKTSKTITIFLLLTLVCSLFAGCGKKEVNNQEKENSNQVTVNSEDGLDSKGDGSNSNGDGSNSNGDGSNSNGDGSNSNKVYKIGVCQMVTHAALDASYQGFIDGLKEAGYEEGKNLSIDFQNAQGEGANCNTIATKLVNDNVDLILAIATNAAQSCANATKDIPIVVTAITDPALSGLVESNEKTGGNVTGTSDLIPIRQQMELLLRLVPEAKNIGVLYCSSESNSKIQADLAKTEAEALGLTVEYFTVSNSNDIQQVIQSMVGKVDAIYAPTDNVIAAGMSTVAMVANSNKIPVICGEVGMVEAGGLAAYGINYYELGKLTAVQAVKILEGTAKPADMPIEYLKDTVLSINQETCDELGLTIPDDVLEELKEK